MKMSDFQTWKVFLNTLRWNTKIHNFPSNIPLGEGFLNIQSKKWWRIKGEDTRKRQGKTLGYNARRAQENRVERRMQEK